MAGHYPSAISVLEETTSPLYTPHYHPVRTTYLCIYTHRVSWDHDSYGLHTHVYRMYNPQAVSMTGQAEDHAVVCVWTSHALAVADLPLTLSLPAAPHHATPPQILQPAG